MLCVVIKGPTVQRAAEQIQEALKYADLVELRIDAFSEWNLKALQTLRSQFAIPMLLTLRSLAQGGLDARTEQERLATLRSLATLQPEYLDIEYPVSPQFIEKIDPKIKLILSYHNFSETPLKLDELYQKMCKIPAHFYKIAVAAKNSHDALKLLLWAKNPRLIAISMGTHGQISRIISPITGSPITYAALDEDPHSPTGQLSAKTLVEQYHHKWLTSETSLYGLIGDPVNKSPSHLSHNRLLKTFNLNGVYLKMPVALGDLPGFLSYAKQLPFKGLSVTMPLKEKILPLLDQIDPQALCCGAVNTLLFDKGKIIGYNTDSMGALNAIENNCSVKDKRIVILGAGGAARAIAYEALRRGAHPIILNRNPERAFEIACTLHCEAGGLDQMGFYAQAGYDILINCTPISPISTEHLLPQALVMDILTIPKETPLLQQAQAKGCRIIYGYQMFIEQALGQFRLWFPDKIDSNRCRVLLEKAVLEFLSEELRTGLQGPGFFSCKIGLSSLKQKL